MSRNITYNKPSDPSFLAKLKAQIGYKEGPTVETKRQKIECSDSEGDEPFEREDEKPQIVVLKEGDLTAEEVKQEEQRIAKETIEAKADLNQRIVFKKRKPIDTETSAKTTTTAKKSKKSENKPKTLLSFNDEDEEA